MLVNKCDRCERLYEKNEQHKRCSSIYMHYEHGWRKISLCPKCGEKLYNWITFWREDLGADIDIIDNIVYNKESNPIYSDFMKKSEEYDPNWAPKKNGFAIMKNAASDFIREFTKTGDEYKSEEVKK